MSGVLEHSENTCLKYESASLVPRREGVFSELHLHVHPLSGSLHPHVAFWLRRSTSRGQSDGLAQARASKSL